MRIGQSNINAMNVIYKGIFTQQILREKRNKENTPPDLHLKIKHAVK